MKKLFLSTIIFVFCMMAHHTKGQITIPSGTPHPKMGVGVSASSVSLLGESNNTGVSGLLQKAQPQIGVQLNYNAHKHLDIRLHGNWLRLQSNQDVKNQFFSGGLIGTYGLYLATKRPEFIQIYGGTGVFQHWGKVKPQNVDTIAQQNLSFTSVPLVAGIRFNLPNNWSVRTEANYHLSTTDLLDGLKQGKGNDSYFTIGVVVSKQISFSSTKKTRPGEPIQQDTTDMDKDGVLDSMDSCKMEKGDANLCGCPLDGDFDNDGVINKEDRCPYESGAAQNKGCKLVDTDDFDNDGVINKEDRCPYESGAAQNKGCKLVDTDDFDNDGVINKEDQCPYESGDAQNKGCKLVDTEDFDKDGVINKDDQCPYVKGPPCNKGCANNGDEDCDGLVGSDEKCPKATGNKLRGKLDSDGDGFIDTEDLCDCEPSKSLCGCTNGGNPNADTDGDGVKNAIDVNVCIKDRDNDGVPDAIDKCPDFPGSKEQNGCPVKK